jgi:hypothetical protein
MLNLKNQIIDKLQKMIVSSSFHVGSPLPNIAEKETPSYHNTYELDYLRSENERLENKVLILQTELDLEKTRSEQLKEVSF